MTIRLVVATLMVMFVASTTYSMTSASSPDMKTLTPSQLCKLYGCPKGYSKQMDFDANTCHCVKQKCPSLSCLATMKCRYGLQTDSITHCPICKCKTVDQELSDLFEIVKVNACPPLCRMYCRFGNQRNSAGCPICACNPEPTLE
ncbi:hypothetical protein C9374_004924 [Naegleria lovaniensis]|uniref:Antistasin-like domain-containing protein n=1 Tax=Naegleria lovaniensis TaxID=51637 RepID=A0AA88GRE9_NAELO|nr:uncharacterized protein C9374_004924 [Naegleria lovaniensis]KAG2382957.1 hypothetical protein C9374_004924 [Naegleria lovaniensis]